jgi:hypothetical protein
MRRIFAAALLGITATVYAQTSVLLEACNNLQDSAKRLQCLKEATQAPAVKAPQPAERMRAAMLTLQNAVNSGVSLSQYRALRLEFVREVGAFKASAPEDVEAIGWLDESLTAYTDAERFWAANLQYGGSTHLLDPDDMAQLGMGEFVKKYSLPFTDLYWNKWLGLDGLPAIWRFAKEMADRASSRMSR